MFSVSDIENIPAEMKEHDIFCCWKEEMRNGKKTKVPYNARTGSRASSNDLSTFSSYDEAVKVMHNYTGLGFIVSHDICAIDLDDCVSEAGEINEIAQNVIAYFPNSYIEKSPSGSGLHIYFKASNFDYDTDIYYINNRKLGIEVYIAEVTKRFLTLTGDVFQDGILEDMTDTLPQFLEVFMKRPSTVRQNDVDEAVSYLSDESVIEKASKSVNREKFRKLWNGNIPSYESRSEADLALASILAFWCGRDIEQMDRLFRQSGLMRDKWDRKQSSTTYGQITLETARRNVFTTYKPYGISSANDDFSDDELKRLKTMQPFKNNHYTCTDIGNSNLFADYYKSVTRYIPERKKWFVYNGQAWESDTGNLKVMQLCKQLANQLMYYALSIEDENIRKTYIDFAKKWQVRRNREIILRDAQDVHPISMSAFDTNKYLLNCKNGTLNLRTNTFHPHCSEDFVTKIAGVHYDPLARCKRWEQFVHEVMSGDVEKATFFQKCLGYALTGDTRYETMFILFGATTRNGKGTSMETFLKICGDYGKTSRPETIGMKINSSSSAPSEDVARLAGSRFVNISEPDKKLTLSAALLKTLTGNDTINARFLHENSFEFKPQFKLFINTNHLPHVTDLTLLTSGRVKIIPFERHFEAWEQDKHLKSTFSKAENLSGILNWAIEGYQKLQETGFDVPTSVQDATLAYHRENDKIGLFIEEQLTEDINGEERTAALYEAYRTWCYANGYYVENARNFNSALSNAGQVIRKRPRAGGEKTTLFLGYTLKEGQEFLR